MPNQPEQWSSAPDMIIEPKAPYLATMQTDQGDIKIKLYADKAPRTVNNFIFLANQGYYNGTFFHRVITNFMAQAGDPTGTEDPVTNLRTNFTLLSGMTNQECFPWRTQVQELMGRNSLSPMFPPPGWIRNTAFLDRS